MKQKTIYESEELLKAYLKGFEQGLRVAKELLEGEQE